MAKNQNYNYINRNKVLQNNQELQVTNTQTVSPSIKSLKPERRIKEPLTNPKSF
jgi:hypothetical protein